MQTYFEIIDGINKEIEKEKQTFWEWKGWKEN